MTRCPRCRLMKPDAVFGLTVGARHPEWCRSCQTHTTSSAGMVTARMLHKSKVPETSSPTPKGVLLFREELRRFIERGAPAIPRTYVYNISGYPQRGGASASGHGSASRG